VSSFFSQVAICVVAILVAIGIVFAIRIGRGRRRRGQELRRRHSGYQHHLGRPAHPPTEQAEPSVNPRDPWQPSSGEGDGRAGPELGYQDQVSKNAGREKASWA
jgi:hypothetical protein